MFDDERRGGGVQSWCGMPPQDYRRLYVSHMAGVAQSLGQSMLELVDERSSHAVQLVQHAPFRAVLLQDPKRVYNLRAGSETSSAGAGTTGTAAAFSDAATLARPPLVPGCALIPSSSLTRLTVRQSVLQTGPAPSTSTHARTVTHTRMYKYTYA